jgi:hypothetical protein
MQNNSVGAKKLRRDGFILALYNSCGSLMIFTKPGSIVMEEACLQRFKVRGRYDGRIG